MHTQSPKWHAKPKELVETLKNLDGLLISHKAYLSENCGNLQKQPVDNSGLTKRKPHSTLEIISQPPTHISRPDFEQHNAGERAEQDRLKELYEKRQSVSAEWDRLFERETALMQKQDLSGDELNELVASNSRFLELLASMEQLETEIHQIYMSKLEESKE